MTDRQRHGFVLLLVVGLIAASFAVIATNKTRLGLDLKGGVELVYKAKPSPESPVNPASLQRAVDVMNSRVNQLGVAQPQITTSGGNQIDVQLPDLKNDGEAERTVGNTAQLFFYDWETNVLTPTGQTAAKGLPLDDPASLALSQGTRSASTGSSSAGAGAMGFYPAVQLASKQPLQQDRSKVQAPGNQFFLFGNRRSLIAGPVQVPVDESRTEAVAALTSGLSNAQKAGATVLEVRQGTQVLQATPANFDSWPKYGSPNTGYYVVRDNVALRGDQISDPVASTDQTGAPDVTFGFKGDGGSVFQRVTEKISQRGGASI